MLDKMAISTCIFSHLQILKNVLSVILWAQSSTKFLKFVHYKKISSSRYLISIITNFYQLICWVFESRMCQINVSVPLPNAQQYTISDFLFGRHHKLLGISKVIIRVRLTEDYDLTQIIIMCYVSLMNSP